MAQLLDEQLPNQAKRETLDRSMQSLLPERWAAEMHPSFKPVTIRLLLEHRAGFKKSGAGVHIRERLKNGVETEEGVGTRHYSNTSMGMFHFILAKLRSPQGMKGMEEQLKNVSDDEYDRRMQDITSAIYNDWTQASVFKPAGVTAGTNPDLFMPNFALAYPQKALKAKPGHKMSDGARHAASGGWLLSTKGMMAFLHALKHTTKILGRRYYALMENVAEPSHSLGWWTSQQVDGGLSFVHNGKRFAGSGSHNAQIINYPNGYQAAAIVNSELPDGFSLLGDLLGPAYNEALQS